MLKASFALRMAAFLVNDLRIDQHQLCIGIFLKGDVDHSESFENADLRRGQAYSMRLIHGLKHVFNQFFQFVIENRDASAGFSRTGFPNFTMG